MVPFGLLKSVTLRPHMLIASPRHLDSKSREQIHIYHLEQSSLGNLNSFGLPFLVNNEILEPGCIYRQLLGRYFFPCGNITGHCILVRISLERLVVFEIEAISGDVDSSRPSVVTRRTQIFFSAETLLSIPYAVSMENLKSKSKGILRLIAHRPSSSNGASTEFTFKVVGNASFKFSTLPSVSRKRAASRRESTLQQVPDDQKPHLMYAEKCIVSVSNQNYPKTGGFEYRPLIRSFINEHLRIPSHFATIFRELASNMTSERGVLLFGPPGTGKTMLPFKCASDLRSAVFVLLLTDVVSAVLGQGEQIIADTFKKAKAAAPCIIFIDEFQAIFSSTATGPRSSGHIISSVLAGCLDDVMEWNRFSGAAHLITVIASTNEPWAIDSSFLRPGRLGTQLFLGTLSTTEVLNLIDGKINEHWLDEGTLNNISKGSYSHSTYAYVPHAEDSTFILRNHCPLIRGLTIADLTSLLQKADVTVSLAVVGDGTEDASGATGEGRGRRTRASNLFLLEVLKQVQERESSSLLNS